MGATGLWNIDQSRCARESLPPDVYLGSSYYEIWIRALEVLLRERGLLAGKDTAAGSILQRPDGAAPRVLRAADVAPVLAKGSPADRTAGAPAREPPVMGWVCCGGCRPPGTVAGCAAAAVGPPALAGSAR